MAAMNRPVGPASSQAGKASGLRMLASALTPPRPGGLGEAFARTPPVPNASPVQSVHPSTLSCSVWRSIFVVILFLACGSATEAQTALPWRWSNPLPHGNNIYDMGFHAGTYWQVTDMGRIYRSTDRTVWTWVDSGSTASLRGIAFRGNEVLVCGESGLILSGGLAGDFQPQTLTPATSNWFEGITASSTIAVAVGDEASVYVREGGTAWSRVSGLPFSDWLRGVGYGDGVFVAVGEDGLVATSLDGRVWKPQTRPVTTHLNRVAFVNGAFYACGADGILLRGTKQGAQWEKISIGASQSVFAYAAEAARPGVPNPIELVAGSLLLRLKSRANGAWEDQLDGTSPLPAPAWSYYTSVWDGERFVLGGPAGMLVESFQTNTVQGTVWLEASDGPRDWLWDLVALPDQYIAVGDRATVLTSENGMDWFRESVPLDLSNAVFLGIGGSTNVVVAAGSNGSLMFSPNSFTNILTTNILTTWVDCGWQTITVVSTNTINLQGLLWHPVFPAPTASTLQGVTERDGLLVVVGDGGTVLTSSSGSTWTNAIITGTPNLSSVAAFAGGFVATGAGGVIYHSPDAVRWEPKESGTTNWVYRVRCFEDQLIAVGQNGLILTSTDGLQWQSSTSRTAAWLNDIIKSDGRYFVCGTQGTLLVSSNLVDWTSSSMITAKSLYGLGLRGGQLIAVGVEGVILRALVESATSVQIVDYEHDECSDFLRDHFVLEGRPDENASIERSLDLVTWDRLGQLHFSDSEATFTLLRTNTPAASTEFFRAVPLAR